MRVETTVLPGVIVFVPQPQHDERGFFSRTFDATIAAEHGVDANAFTQDSQSRSRLGVLRGLHGRIGRGESKLVRCARGAVLDVVVDARPDSPTFGRHLQVRLDDAQLRHLYVPPGLLHGFQVLSDYADVCYRIDRPHEPAEDVAVHYADPELALTWPLPVSTISARDAAAGSWAQLRARLG
jgi:dTDP-4-dehydrorhamnose 3,5-epimerase